MPRSGRGGKRTGKPGTAYSNRSDLTQAASAAPGQGYGVQAQQLRAQATAPLPKQAPPPVPAQGGSGAPGPPPGVSAPMPGALGALDAPSARPNEPITAGLNSGPGPGPEALGGGGLNPIDEVRAMFAADPNDDMRRLVAYLDGQ